MAYGVGSGKEYSNICLSQTETLSLSESRGENRWDGKAAFSFLIRQFQHRLLVGIPVLDT